MGSGSSVSADNLSRSWSLNITHPRHAFSRPSIQFVREASSVQEFSNVAISQHAKLASNRNRVKQSRDVDIQQTDLLWDRKRHIFPNLDALKEFEQKAIKTPTEYEKDLHRLVQYLIKGIYDQATKARVLATWIASHIKYDHKLDSKNQNINEVATVLKTKTALCGGFCRLFEHFCNLAGVECKYISGLARSASFDPCAKFNVDMVTGQLLKSDLHEHAWNILLIDNQWHMVDLTWSAGTLGDGKDGGSQEFQFKWQEEWFFCEPYSFVFTHFPYKNRLPAINRQNMTKPMTIKNWTDSAVFTTVFFDYGLHAVSHPYLWVQSDKSNCAEIQFNSTHDMNFYSKLSKNGHTYNDHCCVSLKNNVVTVRIRLPEGGKFKFELWASLVFAEENLKGVKLLCIYGIEGINKHMTNEPFPKGAWPYWGPTYMLDYLRLEPVTHLDPKVKLTNGEVELIFKMKTTRKHPPKLMFSFHKGDDLNNLKQQFCGWWDEKKIHVKLFVIESGSYRFTVFSKLKNHLEWHRAANYLIEASDKDLGGDKRKIYHFPQWSHLLGPTDQLSRMGVETFQQNGFIQMKDGKFELQFYFEKPMVIEHKLCSLDNPDDDSQDWSRCVYACVHGSQKWITYSIRLPAPGWYFFRLCAEVYEYEEEAVKRPWLANYLFENLNGYDGGFFPSHETLWGLTPEGLEYGIKLMENASSTVTSVKGVADLELESEGDKPISISLENGKGDILSKNFVSMKRNSGTLSIKMNSLKLGYYKLQLKPNDKSEVLFGVFLIVIN